MPRRHDFFKRYHFKRYDERRFRNPYFQPTKKPERPWLKWVILSAALFFMAFIIWLFSAPRFGIWEIKVQGTEFVSSQSVVEQAWKALEKKNWLVLPGNNRFLLNEERVKQILSEEYIFDDVLIEKQSQTMLITVSERLSSLVWQSGDKMYFVDIEGTVTRNLSSEDLNTPLASLPIFVDRSNTEIKVGESVLNKNCIQGTFNFLDLLNQGGVKVKTVFTDSPHSSWLAAKTAEDYEIYFNPDEDVEKQANHLFAILRESISNPSQIDYIDLRFGNHIYFK